MAAPASDAPALPERVDVVVIGGGIIGVSTAWFLARRGVSVLLCERGRIAAEQSSRNWGFVRQQGRAAEEVPLIMESLRIWRGLDKEIGDDTGFHQGGVLYVANNDRLMRSYEAFLDIAKQHQLDTRMLSSAELAAQFPHLAGRWKGALLTPSDGRAEPRLAAPAIARAAERAGATIATGCAVRGLDMAGGRVAGVVTERGRVAASTVVLAGGAWSSLLPSPSNFLISVSSPVPSVPTMSQKSSLPKSPNPVPQVLIPDRPVMTMTPKPGSSRPSSGVLRTPWWPRR